MDTTQPDVDDALDFYGGLFGWEFEEAAPPEAPVRYVMASLGAREVAALTGPDDRTATWNTYVAVDDCEAAADTWRGLGGTVMMPPADAGPEGQAGRAATVADPEGVPIGLWQPRQRLGVQATNEPGAWNFSDLHTADPAAAAEFYAAAFGWRVVDQGWGTAIQVPGYGDHLEATVDPDIRSRQSSAPEGFEDVIGGIAPVTAGEQPHWHVTFTVAERDESAATVERLGGAVLSSAEDDWTRSALVRDPGGAEFTVSQFAPKEWG
ncbi:MAG TPA: VOC family protein [Nocardioides sp.]|nr:VOC family protein [Nocardioides sp.]